MNKCVLLVGRNPTVLAKLALALEEVRFTVKTTSLVEQASQDFNAAAFDLIAFGRGVDERTNADLKAKFFAQDPTVRFVDGLAPVISLLVKQIELALMDDYKPGKTLVDFSCQQTDPLLMQISTTTACQLTIDLYQLDAVHNTQQKRLISKFVSAGNHTFEFGDLPDLTSTINFLVAEAVHIDLAVLPLS